MATLLKQLESLGKITASYSVQTHVAKDKPQWRKYIMPKALVTGGNSKFGKAFVKELSKTHDVVVIPRRHLLSEQIYKYKGQYDIILFNHHYMPEDFNQESFQHNSLICLNLLELATGKRVAWMLSKGIGAKDMPEYAPYFAYKAMNLHIMRYLAHKRKEIYFGIDPGHLIEDHYHMPAKQVVKLFDNVVSGKVYTLNGSVSGL